VSSILLRFLFLWRRRAHISTCIMGFRGTNDIVDVDTGVGTIDDDPVAMYLGYSDI
jgi:hypothetical protein